MMRQFSYDSVQALSSQNNDDAVTMDYAIAF